MTLKQVIEISYRCIRQIDFIQAEEFLTYLRLSGGSWGEGLEVPWIFRGHGNANWELLPRAWRPGIFDDLMPDLLVRLRPYAKEGWTRLRDTAFGSGLGSLRPYINGLDERIIDDRAVSVGIQNALEHEALREFFRLGDELGYPVGDPYYNYNQPPEWIARSSSPGEFQIPEVSGLAQHHGIPTRLLDWTRKPEIAAFFAAESALNDRASKDNLCVWALNPNLINETRSLSEDVKIRLLIPKRHNHTFLHRQEGLFTWIGWAYLYYLKTGAWPSLETVFERDFDGGEPPLRKVTLPTDQAPKLLKLLWRERISRAHLMPTYDNIVEALRMKWCLL